MLPTTFRVPVPIVGPLFGRNSRKLLYFQDCLRKDHALARRIVTAMEDDLFFTFGKENLPIGRIDPNHRTVPGDFDNPMPVTKIGGKVTLKQTALNSKEVGKFAELAEKPDGIDYLLVYSLEATPQIEDK